MLTPRLTCFSKCPTLGKEKLLKMPDKCPGGGERAASELTGGIMRKQVSANR